MVRRSTRQNLVTISAISVVKPVSPEVSLLVGARAHDGSAVRAELRGDAPVLSILRSLLDLPRMDGEALRKVTGSLGQKHSSVVPGRVSLPVGRFTHLLTFKVIMDATLVAD